MHSKAGEEKCKVPERKTWKCKKEGRRRELGVRRSTQERKNAEKNLQDVGKKKKDLRKGKKNRLRLSRNGTTPIVTS